MNGGENVEPVIITSKGKYIPLSEELGEVEELYEQVKQPNGTIILTPYHLEDEEK